MKESVLVFKYRQSEDKKGVISVKKVLRCEGFLRGFGTDHKVYSQGVGNYTTAIVELEDGSFEKLPFELIKTIN